MKLVNEFEIDSEKIFLDYHNNEIFYKFKLENKSEAQKIGLYRKKIFSKATQVFDTQFFPDYLPFGSIREAKLNKRFALIETQNGVKIFDFKNYDSVRIPEFQNQNILNEVMENANCHSF